MRGVAALAASLVPVGGAGAKPACTICGDPLRSSFSSGLGGNKHSNAMHPDVHLCGIMLSQAEQFR